MVGQRAVVHVGAGDDARRRNLLVGAAAFHDQRSPCGDLLMILGIFHAAVAVMRRHCREPPLEERHILGAANEAHVRYRMNEGLGIGDRSLLHQIGPELARQVELDIDLQSLGDVDAAVGPLRCVVDLAIRRVPGAGIVPGLRAFQRAVFQGLEHRYGNRRLQLLEQNAKRGAHDAGADEDDIRCVADCGSHGAISQSTMMPGSDGTERWRQLPAPHRHGATVGRPSASICARRRRYPPRRGYRPGAG
jgi:hypothetical protein